MSHHGLSHPFQGLQNEWNSLTSIFKSKQDAPQAIPPPPDPTKATNDALHAQLQNELNIRRSMALVTGGQGIPGQTQTQTAGQSLMGMS